MNRATRLFFALGLFLIAGNLLAATVTVTIKNFQFGPNAVTINIGDTVKWVNQDGFTHTTTSTTPSGLWDATVAAGASFSRLFGQEGVYSYHCKLHPSMTGTITVRTPEQTRMKIGQNIIAQKIVPISLNLTGKNQNLAYLGSYIVNAQSGCADCHSCPTYASGHNPYLGQSKQFNAVSYLAGGVPFGGLVSANITPNASGLPAGLTRSAFKSLLRTGHDPDVAGAILQIMPWPVFGMMSDRDLDAVYEYLRSIPSRSTPTNACTGAGQ